MAPERQLRRVAACLAVLAALVTLAPAAHALRIVNYNILNYPGPSVSVRNPHFRTILEPLEPDVVVVQEMTSQAGVDSFRNNVLNVLWPGEWASAPFINGNDTDNALFYRTTKVQFLGGWAWYPNPLNLLRLVNCYRLKPVGYVSEQAEFRVYSQHLKASTGSTNEAQRLAEATGIRDSMNAVPPGTHCILTGDFNIYSGAEPAFTRLLESQADNDGRLYDPLNAPLSNWNSVPSLAALYTQSPCNGVDCASGASTGGLDDRFDMFLPTYNMRDGDGLDLLASTYVPVGNDGLHFNMAITDPPTIPEGAAYADALLKASDHLPIRVDLQLPAKMLVPVAALDFGTAIVGATVTQSLAVTNPAAPPADTLEYSFAIPAGFTAPAGTLAVLPENVASDAIGLDTATPGVKAGTLVVSGNDFDNPTDEVALSGTVLRHAEPSLDSLVAALSDTLDFGDHAAGGFAAALARLHNRGFDALQARLSVNAATLGGPAAARFAITGFSAPTLVSGSAAGWPVTFDDSGAPADSTYRATLTFQSADEALPGAAARPDVVLHLRARVTSGTVSAPVAALPAASRLFAPYPNPLRGSATVRFDLARPAAARVEVFDLAGRRVARLADRAFEPGSYRLEWNGADDAGRPVGAGLYFVRLSGDGVAPSTARLAVMR
uniref:Choice-of-anchor D domain-containing protein n=1 Tax=Eiseniibacteriota bacterium TaxID=2212470 RepID=A0A832I305_UNCEI